VNPDGYVIPITEDDQGEQFMDPVENETVQREFKREKLLKKLEAQYEAAAGRPLDQERIMKRANKLTK